MRGALAYVTNHEADALELLGGADLTALDVRLAGPIAFARSVLKTRKDPKAAIADLDWARLLAPGGLVEEAALRREIGLLAEAHDAPRVAQLSRQYAERFAASLYAPDFFHDLARIVARTGIAEDPANFRLLSAAVARMPAEGQRDFLLTLAHAATVGGRFDAAASAASEVLRRAAPGSVEEARGRLYLDAGRIFSDGAYDTALADLRQISVAKLDRSDVALRAAALGVAAQLRVTPDAAAVEVPGAGRRRRRQGWRTLDHPKRRGGAAAHRKPCRHRRARAMTVVVSASAPAPAAAPVVAHVHSLENGGHGFSAALDALTAGEGKAKSTERRR